MSWAALAAILLLAVQAEDDAADLTILNTAFFVTDVTQGEEGTSETTRVPNGPGQICYTWAIAVEPQPGMIAVRELFELPASAQQWNTEPGDISSVSEDQSKALTEVPESIEDGLITHGWCVAEGDPSGPHRIRVYLGERLLHDFRFELVDDTY